jgi:hypothetical protein
MKNVVLFFLVLCLAISDAISGDCPVDVFLLERGKGLIEVVLKNNMEKPYEIRYDALPWVLAGKGVDFEIFINGTKIRKASGIGHSSLVIIIGAGSYISSVVDVGYLRSFYEGVDKEDVLIKWRYEIPGDEIPGRCKFRAGSVAVP